MNPVLPLERFYGFWNRRNPMQQGEVAGVVRQMMSIYVGVMVYGGILSSVMLFNAASPAHPFTVFLPSFVGFL